MSDDRFDNRRYYNEDTFSIQSTAGAVPVRNKKGEVSMEKVKVSRYISGKRPEYASRGRDERSSSESDSSDEEDFTKQRQKSPKHEVGVLKEDFIPYRKSSWLPSKVQKKKWPMKICIFGFFGGAQIF